MTTNNCPGISNLTDLTCNDFNLTCPTNYFINGGTATYDSTNRLITSISLSCKNLGSTGPSIVIEGPVPQGSTGSTITFPTCSTTSGLPNEGYRNLTVYSGPTSSSSTDEYGLHGLVFTCQNQSGPSKVIGATTNSSGTSYPSSSFFCSDQNGQNVLQSISGSYASSTTSSDPEDPERIWDIKTGICINTKTDQSTPTNNNNNGLSTAAIIAIVVAIVVVIIIIILIIALFSGETKTEAPPYPTAYVPPSFNPTTPASFNPTTPASFNQTAYL